MPVVRIAALILAVAAFLPWYSSQALVDQDTYLGNPLPLIDWVVLAVALATVVRPRLALLAAAVGLIDITLGWLLMYVDAAEGLEVPVLPGLPLATVASIALLVAHVRGRSERSSVRQSEAA